jgi:hypothetical protein
LCIPTKKPLNFELRLSALNNKDAEVILRPERLSRKISSRDKYLSHEVSSDKRNKLTTRATEDTSSTVGITHSSVDTKTRKHSRSSDPSIVTTRTAEKNELLVHENKKLRSTQHHSVMISEHHNTRSTPFPATSHSVEDSSHVLLQIPHAQQDELCNRKKKSKSVEVQKSLLSNQLDDSDMDEEITSNVNTTSKKAPFTSSKSSVINNNRSKLSSRSTRKDDGSALNPNNEDLTLSPHTTKLIVDNVKKYIHQCYKLYRKYQDNITPDNIKIYIEKVYIYIVVYIIMSYIYILYY